MSKAKILVCLDTDPQPSVFDGVVAVDAGVDQLFRHGGVTPEVVRNLVYGAIFTRGIEDLQSTAVFVGGSNVTAGEAVMAEVQDAFFGPMRTSVMLDSNGANTTAAATVLAARRHVSLRGLQATVLAATGSVGKRVVRLLAEEGASVRVCSRKLEAAEQTCKEVKAVVADAHLQPLETSNPQAMPAALEGTQVLVASGPPAVELASAELRAECSSLEVALDLNAVPPLGLGGVEVQDHAVQRDGHLCYGALGVGGTKMKIHKAAVARLFDGNDQVLDALEIYALGKELEG
ncbi:NAD(P)-dependent methylenetetrahydromethanopterin dehydrogenase [Adhaeretor mobilis]|uniref:Bifunctional protein MdtA n=1 Tax=Adhaeretor mobilis TaxID=1930276 RepID=A0A517MRH7_9BACT|nr:NAD(P)-dependent methylenetetrahydromethanopterin dehydrogenase [Adhaeretor mobilis]QDS97466.1 Bifunctional protein MdtA [Adhaeretor mobilis]